MAIKNVESQIEGLQNEIEDAKPKSEEGKNPYWTNEVEQLRKKEEQLRKKEEQLRDEKNLMLQLQANQPGEQVTHTFIPPCLGHCCATLGFPTACGDCGVDVTALGEGLGQADTSFHATRPPATRDQNSPPVPVDIWQTRRSKHVSPPHAPSRLPRAHRPPVIVVFTVSRAALHVVQPRAHCDCDPKRLVSNIASARHSARH